MANGLRVLILDGGGRGGALDRVFMSSTAVSSVFVAPGNGGIDSKRRRPIDLSLSAESVQRSVIELVRGERIDLVVPGEEKFLVDGGVDFLAQYAPEVIVLGPRMRGSWLEGSKQFFKCFCQNYGLPTADFHIANTLDEARGAIGRHMQQFDEPPVIKANGLCNGKGVVVAETVDQAMQAAAEMLENRIHGDAGSTIIIEKRLRGRECSLMGFVDGKTFIPLRPAREYKRLHAGQGAPNTGGMAAYTPLPDVEMGSAIFGQLVALVQRLVDEVNAEGSPYHGPICAAFMLTPDGPMFIEINCRLNDPEAQVVLLTAKSDLVPIMLASCEYDGFHLHEVKPIEWLSDAAVCIVKVAGGYPGKSEKGMLIHGLDAVRKLKNVSVIEAGTEVGPNGEKLVNGGRVLNLIGFHRNPALAAQYASDAAELVDWPGAFHRNDIPADIAAGL